MSTTRIIIAGVVGAVAAFILSSLAYAFLLATFFENNAGSATGVVRADEDILFIPMLLGHLAWGIFISWVLGYWASISTAKSGANAGALMGFSMACVFGLINLSTTHVSTPIAAVVDIAVFTVISAVVGAIVGLILSKAK